jgi:flagellar hook-length control protein FliK
MVELVEPVEVDADADALPRLAPIPMWIAVTATAEMGVAAMGSGGAERGSTYVPPQRLVATAPAPVATLPVLVSPIVDEDLLLWRSKLSSAPMTSDATTAADDGLAPHPSSLPLALTGEITANMDPSIPAASTSVRLRARAAVMSVPDLGAAQAAAVVAADAKGTETDLASTDEVRAAVLTDGFEPAGRRAATVMSVTPNDAEGIQGEAPQSGLVRTTATTELFASASSMAPTAYGDLMATVGEASRTLATPDPKLSFGERVQAFADAVAQRMLGQIRKDDWTVSLQLEPADMGTLDIDLTLRGNAVAATVGVTNGEVRALLESGLPRLRESLESAGLQLAGWTFGQSGSRGFGESARKPLSQAAYRVRTTDVGPISELGLPLLNPRKDAGTSAVDLFV